MGRAFLALYEVTGQREWLNRAVAAAAFIEANFASPLGYVSSAGTKMLTAQPALDENIPLARFTNALFHYTGNQSHRKTAEAAMRFSVAAEKGARGSTWEVLTADDELAREPLHITIVGSKSDEAARALFAAALALPETYRRIEWWDRSEGALPRNDVTYPPLPRSAAFVCTANRCSLPVFRASDLGAKIAVLTAASPT